LKTVNEKPRQRVIYMPLKATHSCAGVSWHELRCYYQLSSLKVSE